jgi:acetyl esterase/lipase
MQVSKTTSNPIAHALMGALFLSALPAWAEDSGAVAAGPAGEASLAGLSYAGTLSERIAESRLAQQLDEPQDDAFGRLELPPGVRLVRDVAYGKSEQQRMDVYLPRHAAGAPVIVMVHGGGWRRGDKGAQGVVQNKMSRWTSQGFIFISINYRLLPEAAPIEQAHDVARALAAAQGKAEEWGGDPEKFILMGHSAGAHLSTLLAASPELARQAGVRPWLGTVALDSAAFNVVQIMETRHPGLYDQAFGDDPAYWRRASPYYRVTAAMRPLLAVCSTRRDESCQQAHQFDDKAATLKVRVKVLEEDLSHGEINKELGIESSYTDAVESFMGSLDAAVWRTLFSGSGNSR